MIGQRMVVVGLLGSLVVVGCAKKKPEMPAPQAQADDSAARAEQERLAAEQAAREKAAQEAAAAREREVARARAVLTDRIHFNYDDSSILPEAQQTLMQKVDVLRKYPQIQLRIAGNCDERGSVEYNLALGMRRANAAKDFLVNYGLSASRFETVSYGEERPIAMGHDEAAWAQNRRDDFDITAGAETLGSAAGDQQ
jgi:peptidoglycan-associated lipoprotein